MTSEDKDKQILELQGKLAYLEAAYKDLKVEANRHRVSWKVVEKENKKLRGSDAGKFKAELDQVRYDLECAEGHIADIRAAGRLICGLDD